MEDMQWAVLSIFMCVIMLLVHLRSKFLTLVSGGLIIFSLPVAVLINQGIFQSSFFGQMHMTVVFIVIGISADDLFVFMDAWR